MMLLIIAIAASVIGSIAAGIFGYNVGKGQSKKLIIKNQLNGGPSIDFCCEEKEYKLGYEEEVTIEVKGDVCMYFDVVK